MPPAPPRPWLDVLAVLPLAALVAVGAQNLPWPASLYARFLNGADAGEWALNAQRVLAGDFAGVDPHRPPGFLLAIAAARPWVDSIAEAGHLVDAISWMVLPFATYALGRAFGGRLAGLVAGLLVVGSAPLLQGAGLFSVDPLITALLPLTLAAVAPARRWPLWAWAAGALAGVLACTHLTMLPYWLPALLLMGWHSTRTASRHSLSARILLFVSGLVAVGLAAKMLFGALSPAELLHSVSEGVARNSPYSTTPLALSQPAVATLEAGQDGALESATHALLLPLVPTTSGWLGWVIALWLGILGISLGTGSGPPDRPPLWWRWANIRGHRRWHAQGPTPAARLHRAIGHLQLDLGAGLVLTAALLPAVLFAAAEAPDRYTRNLLPIAAVVIGRGVASALHTLRRCVPEGGTRKGASVVLSLGLLGALGPSTYSRVIDAGVHMPSPGEVPRAAQALANALAVSFPGDSAIATPFREAAAHLGRQHCPRRSCLGPPSEAAFRVCLATLRSECGGSGPIPYVWLEHGPVGMGDDPFTQAFGAWAAATWPPTRSVSPAGLQAHLIAIPRTPQAPAP